MLPKYALIVKPGAAKSYTKIKAKSIPSLSIITIRFC